MKPHTLRLQPFKFDVGGDDKVFWSHTATEAKEMAEAWARKHGLPKPKRRLK